MKLPKSMVAWAIVFVATWLLLPRPSWTGAAEPTEKAAGAPLQIVGYANGSMGFFDPSTNRLYVYGADMRTPVMVVEVLTLGQPLKLVQRSAR
jgi:hypothetical protein